MSVIEREEKPRVLIVDDEAPIRGVLEGFLFKEGYDLNFAAGGPEALACLETQPPDVILLDVMMPDMDGFQVCRRIKGDKRWQHIPIILVTALSSKDDLARGLEAGADDFLNKPVDSIELRARVRSLLRVKEQYDRLQAMLDLREDLTHMIVHDIRTPLTAIMGYSQLILARNSLPAGEVKDVAGIQIQANRLESYLNDMLLLAKLETDHLILNQSMVDVNQLFRRVEESYAVVAQSRKIKLLVDLPPETREISLDANLFQRVVENLLSNALKYSPPEKTVILRVAYPTPASASRLRLQVLDEGPGIAEEHRERVFDKFEIVKLREQEGGDLQVGLGLAFCKMVVDAHGGCISVEPNQPAGSVFTVEI